MPQWRAAVDIPATARGPAAARRVVAALLPAWELDDLAQDAELVISELVTNAMSHAAGTDSFALELARRDDGLRIALADGSALRPVIGDLAHHRSGGRGMAIIQALASAWGAEDREDGKCVWVDIDRSV